MYIACTVLILITCLSLPLHSQVAIWRPVYRFDNTRLAQPVALDSSRIVMSGYDRTENVFFIAATRDAAISWQRVFELAAPSLNEVPAIYSHLAYPTPNVIVAATSNDTNRIIRSEDAGQSWSLTELATLASIQHLSMFDDRIGIAGVYGEPLPPSYLVATDDGWRTWRMVQFPKAVTDSFYVMRTICLSPTTYLCLMHRSDQQMLLLTEDAGNSWVDIRPFAQRHSLNELSFNDSLNGWAIGARRSASQSQTASVIYRTWDGGLNWHLQLDSSNAPELTSVRFIDSANGIATGVMTVYRTTDGGARWTRDSIESEEYLGALYVALASEDRSLLVSQAGVILENDERSLVSDETFQGLPRRLVFHARGGERLTLRIPIEGAERMEGRLRLFNADAELIGESRADRSPLSGAVFSFEGLPRGVYLGTARFVGANADANASVVVFVR